jgi:hypothetical protein
MGAGDKWAVIAGLDPAIQRVKYTLDSWMDARARPAQDGCDFRSIP